MVLHVGIDAHSGNIATYNNITKETKNYNIEHWHKIQWYPIIEIYEKIKDEAGGDFGYACVVIKDNKHDDIRKRFIKKGEEYGFKKVLIINSFTEMYLDYFITLKEKPKTGDIFWVFTKDDRSNNMCIIWEKMDTKEKFIKIFADVSVKTETNLLQIKENSGIKKVPNLIIFDSRYYGDFSNIVKNVFPDCKYISYKKYLKVYETALIKARIAADDPDLDDDIKKCDINNYINGKARVRVGSPSHYHHGDIILNLNLPLPFEKTLVIPVEVDDNKLQETYDIPQEPLINPNINAVGIDLGMTRCCAAVNRNDRFELVAIDNSERQLPSYVSFKEKDPNCGQLVINQLEFYASSTVFDIKRIIGRNLNEIDKNPAWPFEVIRIDSKPLIYMKSCGNVLMKYPEEVTAVLLKHMKKKIEEFQGKIMDEAVITIPAGFNQNQKIATHVAADLAGFKTVHLLAEPIAASIAYFVDRPIPSNFNVLLFDLGGGTLDLCIFKVENNKLKIIAKDGDSNLGGRDFDNLLFQHFEKILETKYKITMNEKSKYRLMLKCVEIKHTLSAENEASLDVDVFNPEIEEFLKITRQEFEQFSATLLLRLHECLKQTFAQAKIYASDINKVLLVGGGCRMPMIQLFLRKRFPKAEHICAENPDEMVAIGAAYYSSFLMSNNGGGYCNIM